MQEGHTPTVPMASASLNAEELRNRLIWQTYPCDPLNWCKCHWVLCLLVNCVTLLTALPFGQWSIV